MRATEFIYERQELTKGVAPTPFTAYQAIQSVLGKDNVTDNDEDMGNAKYLVYRSPRTLFIDHDDMGAIEIKDPDSRDAREVAIAVHEACHAWIHARAKGGRVSSNEKIVNQLAEKWLRKHLSGVQLHVALEAIVKSRISYGSNHMPKSSVSDKRE
jgi:hypothetical protein